MMERTKRPEKTLSNQMKHHANGKIKKEPEYDGNFETIVSTGSTLLDLSISGKRIRGGGLPGGIVVEVFGPSQSGKTVLLAEVAGGLQRIKNEIQFHDPEARLDHEFISIFGMKVPAKNYFQPDTVTEVFDKVKIWKPELTKINMSGIFVDSSAALSTDLEMTNKEGDKMGGRRAKEFSEQLRKMCRFIKQQNYIMMFSNQIRDNFKSYGPDFVTPGGHAFEFYASGRIRFNSPEKITKTIQIAGKEVKKTIGIKTPVEVIKTVDEPYRKCDIYIIYGYGIDDIRGNLQYIKDFTTNKIYTCNGMNLDNSLDKSIAIVESDGLEKKLREEVINLWEEIDAKFKIERKPKR